MSKRWKLLFNVSLCVSRLEMITNKHYNTGTYHNTICSTSALCSLCIM